MVNSAIYAELSNHVDSEIDKVRKEGEATEEAYHTLKE